MTDTDETTTIRPEDEKVPVGKAFFFGLQHILAMYAGVVSPPCQTLSSVFTRSA